MQFFDREPGTPLHGSDNWRGSSEGDALSVFGLALMFIAGVAGVVVAIVKLLG